MIANSKISVEGNKLQLTSLWVAGMIIVLGLVLFGVVVSTSGKGEKALINEFTRLHIATSDTDNITAILELNKLNWDAINDSNFALSKKAHWFSVEVSPDELGRSQLVEVSFSNLDKVDAWFLDKLSGQQKTILAHYKTGDSLEFNARDVKHDQLIFPVPMTGLPNQLYLRVESQSSLKVPIKLWVEDEYIQYIGSNRVFIGIFYGFMSAMALLNLFLYISSRNPITLLYAGYVICLSITLAGSQGLGYRFLWPDSPAFQQYAVLFFVSLMAFFSSSFTASLLDIKQHHPFFLRLFNALRIIILIYILLIFIIPYGLVTSIATLVIVMSILIIFISTLLIAYKGNAIAKYLCAAWFSLLFSGLLGLADSFGWINLHLDPSYLLMVGAVIETLFMALGIAIRFNDQRLLAKQARTKAAQNKQNTIQAKEALMSLQLETKEKLEYAVDERTYELEIAIRELNEANHELERKSSIDALTGVANRRSYDKKVVAEARRSRREKTPLAIAMLDIDNFKAVNDTFGHQCGDEALKHFANVLKNCIKRPSDVICRYGGEEFVVILPNTDIEGARLLMESVRSSTENSQIQCDGKTIKFTVSIGVSTRVIATDTEYELLNAFADKLLYQAKESGRNQVKALEF